MSQDCTLYDLLVCPKCHSTLDQMENPEGFVCHACELFYRISNGIPNMLIDEAQRWPLSEPEDK